MSEGPRITGHTRVFGLVGHRARYSLSPEMHNALLARLEIDAVYLLFDANPNKAQALAEAIRVLDLSGVNLTVPFKERIMPWLDHLTVAAREAGAVNLVTQVEGVLTGYNTDGEGLVASVAAEHGFQAVGRVCVVLGAGGAGRAVASSLAAAGAARVVLLNRSEERVQRAVSQLGEHQPDAHFEAGALEPASMERWGPEAGLVVNCLGSGAEGLVESLPIEVLGPEAIWVDINYWMDEPPRVAACAERGLATSTGIGMLVHQAALSFELFTGHPVDPEELRSVLK